MSRSRTRVLLTSGLLVASVPIGSTVPAGAADQPRPGVERCTSAIDRRLQTLADLGDRARASGPLTDAHQATITTTTEQQARDLTALRAEVVAAATPAARAASCRRVVPDFRVYVLTRPKVHLTIGADTAVAASTRLDGAVATLQHAVDQAKAAGRDVAAPQAKVDAARAETTAGRDLAAGIPDTVLVLVPSGYPANATALTSSRTALTAATGKLRAAAQDAKDARDLLRP